MVDFLWGLWNGITAWLVFIVHIFGAWEQFPVYNIDRDGSWYQVGFLPGVFIGALLSLLVVTLLLVVLAVLLTIPAGMIDEYRKRRKKSQNPLGVRS